MYVPWSAESPLVVTHLHIYKCRNRFCAVSPFVSDCCHFWLIVCACDLFTLKHFRQNRTLIYFLSAQKKVLVSSVIIEYSEYTAPPIDQRERQDFGMDFAPVSCDPPTWDTYGTTIN